MSATFIGSVNVKDGVLAVYSGKGGMWSGADAMCFKMQMGALQIQDVGKRVYYDADTRAYTMENNEQRDLRQSMTMIPLFEDRKVVYLDHYRK